MWAAIKSDPLLKAVTVIILGVLGFGFAFNMMFGQRSITGSTTGHSDMSGGSTENGGEMTGNSFSNNLSYWLLIVLKLLLIALVIFAIIAIFKFIGKNLLNGEGANVNRMDKNTLSTLAVISLIVLAIGVLIVMFGGYLGLGNGFGVRRGETMAGNYYGNQGMMGDNQGMMGGNQGMMGGYYYGNPGMMNGNGYFIAGNNGFSLSIIMAVLLKLLLYVSVIGLIVGLCLYFYKGLLRTAERTQPIDPISTGTVTCSVCDANIPINYNFCPVCGTKAK